MKLLMILLLTVPAVYSQFPQCQPDVVNYLTCMSTEMSNNFGTLENQYIQLQWEKTKECFTADGDADKCKLMHRELTRDLSHPQGPLRGCRLCRTIARLLRNAFMKTKPGDLKCIRQRLSVAIRNQLTPCLKRKLGDDFVVPDLPELAGGMDNHRKKMELSTRMFINMVFRVKVCRAKHPTRFEATDQCLQRPKYTELAGIERMQALCEKSISSDCIQPFGEVKGSLCECLDEALVEHKNLVAKLRDVIAEVHDARHTLLRLPGCSSRISNAACHCVARIKQQLKTPQVDWFDVANDMLHGCISGKRPRRTLTPERLLELGCERAFKMTSYSGKSFLELAFIFANHWVEAIISRVSQVCQ